VGSSSPFTLGDDLQVFDAVTRLREWRVQPLEPAPFSMAFGDVDGDSRNELVLSDPSALGPGGDVAPVTILDAATHEVEYRPPPGFASREFNLAMANVDPDPQPEIFVASTQGSRGLLVCYDGLTRAAQWRVLSAELVTFGEVEVGDLDLDGAIEVVVAGWDGGPNGSVYVYEATTGALRWRGPLQSGGGLLSLANVDLDPQPEIVLVYPPRVWVIDGTTHEILDLGQHDARSLVTLDRNGDGSADIIVSTGSGSVQVLGLDGQVAETLGQFPGQIQAMLDLDQDGREEMVFADTEGMLVYRGTALLWRSGRLGLSSRLLDAGDVDRDGRIELVIAVDPYGTRVYEIGVLPEVTIHLSDAVVRETETNLVFELDLSSPQPVPVSVRYSTEDGSATAGRDYLAVSGTLTFSPGTTRQRLAVAVLEDNRHELTEEFVLRLTDPQGAILIADAAIGRIGDSGVLGLTVDEVRLSEPLTGSAQAFFTIRLSRPLETPVSVDYATRDGSALAGTDYTAVSGTLTFAPGEDGLTVAVRVFADAMVEGTEAFYFDLSDAVGTQIAVPHVRGVIEDHDSLFHTIKPCRLLDTRYAPYPASSPNPLVAGEARFVFTRLACGLPDTARALSANVTVTRATGPGNLRLGAVGSGLPETSTINFSPGETRANNAIVPLGPRSSFAIFSGQPSGEVDVIVDVNGFLQ
jgi:hypothetical protein